MSEQWLKCGWYRLEVTKPDAVVVLTLNAPEFPLFIEITATADTPGYAKLATGNYTLAIRCCPQDAEWRFNPAPLIDRWLYFATHLRKTLKSKTWSIGQFFRQIRRALVPNGHYGSISSHRPPSSRAASSPAATGPFSKAQWLDVSRAKPPLQGDIRVFVKLVGKGDAAARSLAEQDYTNFTTDPDLAFGCDAVVELPACAKLGASSLRQLVLPMSDPSVMACYAPVFIGEDLSYVFGYDPRLHSHADMLADLVLTRQSLSGQDGALAGLTRAQLVRIDAPLAVFSQSVNSLSTGRRLPPPPPPCVESISCIIPTRDRADLLHGVTSDLLDKTEGVADIIVVDNGSVEATTHVLFDQLRQRGVKIVVDNGDFNFSRLCNFGASYARGKVLAFINNDIRLRTPSGLSQMAGWAIQEDVGAVGTRLLYADESLQHGGVALGLGGLCGHLFRGWRKENWQNLPNLAFAGSRSAVTGALLVVETRKFLQVNGFDSANFPVVFNDIDLCLRLQQQGWNCVYEPAGEAFHFESQSRTSDLNPENIALWRQQAKSFLLKWREHIDNDPWIPANMAMDNEYGRFI